jgi:hypothetical protein
MWKLTVSSSTAVALSMYSQTTLRARRYAQAVVMTSLEVIGLPSLHLRPELSLTVNVLALELATRDAVVEH